MPESQRITAAVVGAGAWGTAISLYMDSIGIRVRLWAYEKQTARDIDNGENKIFLPGFTIPGSIGVTTDISSAINNAAIIFFAVPVQHLRSVLETIPDSLDLTDRILVNLAKGIERGTALLPSEIIEDVFGNQIRVIALSGPSFADEVAQHKPTVLVASGDLYSAEIIQHLIASNRLRVYRSPDRLGVELSGAMKNVHALAAGISDGLDLGQNTRAALIVRGLAETSRFAEALGADPRTISGIAGLGDLVLTCTSTKSRNYRLGTMIASGKTAEEIFTEVPWIAEGVYTSHAALKMAEKNEIELPITQELSAVLLGEKTPVKAVNDLMNRPLKPEYGKTGLD